MQGKDNWTEHSRGPAAHASLEDLSPAPAGASWPAPSPAGLSRGCAFPREPAQEAAQTLLGLGPAPPRRLGPPQPSPHAAPSFPRRTSAQDTALGTFVCSRTAPRHSRLFINV